MKILNSLQMADADKFTIEQLKIPSVVLMENASYSVYGVFENLGLSTDNIAIIVGSGNNGGDGLALARILINKNYNPDIFLTTDPANFKGDAKTNYDILCNYGVSFNIIKDARDCTFATYDVIFDAIFGTGLTRPVSGKYEEIILQINDTDAIIISIDIPSGLSGSSSQLIGANIYADYTVTFCCPKIPHCLYPAKEYCGYIYITDISIPEMAVEKQNSYLTMLHIENLPNIKPRDIDSHKGTYGHAVVIGGSRGKSGAVIMAAKACHNTGAGLTTTVLPESINTVFEATFLEGMSLSLSNENHIISSDIDIAVEFLNDKTVAAIGPGAGQHIETKLFINEIINKTSLPLVIDADGINCLDKKSYPNLQNRAILTPHLGEFARLLNISIDELKDNRIELLRSFSMKNQIYIVLKSADSLIATPEGDIFVSNFGTPALAKGGSGDCLTGIITGLISQEYSLEDACKLGCALLGKTAEILSEEKHVNCITATKIIDNIWKAFNEFDIYS